MMAAIHFLVVLLPLINAVLVTIDNRVPRLDVNGKIFDAHDGSIQQFEPGGLYYMHAIQYGLCHEAPNYGCDAAFLPEKCGFRLDHNISIWTSPNLTSGSWTYAGNAINVTDRPAGMIYRPHVVYNPNTKMYVLMWEHTNFGVNGQLVVAASASPLGPFLVVNPVLNVTYGSSGDFSFFADTDGSGYVIYRSNSMSIEKITPDFYYVANTAPYVFPETFVEAPDLFKANGTYYALYDWCCCFCMQGSGILVFRADSPLGPYTQQPGGDIGCVPMEQTDVDVCHNDRMGGIPTPGQGCQYRDAGTTSITRAQQNYVIKVTNAQGGTSYIWTGDRWQQAPDGLKGHTPQYWMPLHFNDDGSISKAEWVDQFTVNV